MSEISLTKIVNLVGELKLRIERHKDKLAKNEVLVRYVLVDPLLRALGWVLEDPDQVEPEYVVESGRADYALKRDGRVVAYIEVKPLGGISEDVIREKLKYAFDSGVEYTVVTDGDTWLVYETFKKAEWRDRKVSEWSVTREDPVAVALKSLILANTPALGRRPERPVFERQPEGPGEKPTTAASRVAKVKGPLNSKKARYLVLRVLAESGKPIGRGEIVERARELVELASRDFEKTKSGRVRWETFIRWAISSLREEGYIKRLDSNQYVINEKGRQHLSTLENEILSGARAENSSRTS